MINSRRRRRGLRLQTLDEYVQAGYAALVSPASDAGWRPYSSLGREFLPAATNIVPDPQGVLADGTFWPADGAHNDTTANVDVPVPVPTALSGLTKCLQITNDGTAEDASTANLVATASKDYYTSLYVYAPTVGGNIIITAEVEDGAHSFALGTISAANSGWTRYSVKSATVALEDTIKVKFAFAGGSASTIYVTGAQIVQESVLTPFFCGASAASVFGSGSTAWTGTANASTSTRAASSLRFANPFPAGMVEEAGSIGQRWTPLAAYNALTYYHIRSYGGTGATFADTNQVGEWRFSYQAPVAHSASVTGQRWAAGESLNCVGRYNNGASGTVDAAAQYGANAVSNAIQATFNETGATGWTYYPSFDYSATPLGRIYGSMLNVVISPTRKSDAWKDGILSGYGTALGSSMTLFDTYLAVGDILWPLTSNSYGYKKLK